MTFWAISVGLLVFWTRQDVMFMMVVVIVGVVWGSDEKQSRSLKVVDGLQEVFQGS